MRRTFPLKARELSNSDLMMVGKAIWIEKSKSPGKPTCLLPRLSQIIREHAI